MEQQYFDRVPDWPDFDITLDPISGRIPVTKLAGWQQFTNILDEEFFNRLKTQLVFRGHRRHDWSLTPSLGRLDPSGIISGELAGTQLDLFRHAVRGRLRDTSLVEVGEEDELWSVGQHHGLNTPLLDWTYSPFVALFFAFVKEDPKHEEDNPYRVIYVLNKSFIADGNVCPDIRVLEPRKDEHGRLVNQAGLFTFFPYDNTIENSLIDSLEEEALINVDEKDEAKELAQYICKIYIGNEDRDGCLRHLRRMNVHHASLFPDLLGASDYCNILVEEDNNQKLLERAERKAHEKEDIEPAIDLVTGKEELHIEEAEEKTLIGLLGAPAASAQLAPSRIQIIANELAREFKRNKVIDWEDRDAVKARLRNLSRAILRKYHYPTNIRGQIIDDLIDAAMKEVESKE